MNIRNCAMCSALVLWFEKWDDWRHVGGDLYCKGKASVATPEGGDDE